MNHQGALRTIVALCLACCLGSRTQTAAATDSTLVVSALGNGEVRVELRVASPVAHLSPAQRTAVFLAAVPFQERPEWNIVSAPDVKVSPLSGGTGYTILAIRAQTDQDSIPITIERCVNLRETPEGRSQLEFDLSYPFLTQADRDALLASTSVYTWTVRVVLPSKYNYADVSFAPPQLTRVDDRSYQLDASTSLGESAGEIWIAFPNPMQRSLLAGQFIVSLLLGSITALVHWYGIKDRRLIWTVVTAVLGLLALAVAFYLGITLHKRLEFLVSAGLSIPHVLVGVIASIYFTIARFTNASITGVVSIDGVPAVFATVVLYRIHNGQAVRIAQVDELQEGRYHFSKLIKTGTADFRVKATAEAADGVQSPTFSMGRGEKRELGVLALRRQA